MSKKVILNWVILLDEDGEPRSEWTLACKSSFDSWFVFGNSYTFNVNEICKVGPEVVFESPSNHNIWDF